MAKQVSRRQSGPDGVDPLTAPARVRRAVAADIRRVLRAHGIRGRFKEVHVEPASGSATGKAALTGPCPPGTVRTVVCFVDAGTFVCEERCVPRPVAP